MKKIGLRAGVSVVMPMAAVLTVVAVAAGPAAASTRPMVGPSERHLAVDSPVTTVPNLPPLPGTSVVAPVTAAPITASPVTTAPVPATAASTVPVTVAPPIAPTTAPLVDPETYVPLVDDSGLLTVEVPVSWSDTDLREFVQDDGHLVPAITAAPNWDDFLGGFTTPGMMYAAYPFGDPEALFDEFGFPNSCRDAGRVPYDDGAFVGGVQTWSDCDGTTGAIHVVVANPPTNAYTLLLFVQTASAADDPAYQHLLDTFNVDSSVTLTTETAAPTSVTPTTTLTVSPTAAPPTTLGVPVPPPTLAPTTTVTVAPTVAPTIAPTTVATVGPTVAPTIASPTGYRLIGDDSHVLSVQVPDWWTDINGAAGDDNGTSVPALSAAPDLDRFRTTFDVPGLFMYETTTDIAAALDRWNFSGTCADGGLQANPNPAFVGQYQVWQDCGGTSTDLYVLAANPVDGRAVTVVVFLQIVDDDLAAVQTAFTTFALA